MHAGRRDAGGTAPMVLTLDAPAPAEIGREIREATGIARVKAVRL